MTAESAEHNQSIGPSIGQSRGEALPQGLAMRQSWQPIATQKTEALMAGIGQRTAPMLEHVLQVSDWYEQFTRRVQPWSGWTALPQTFPSASLSNDISPHETAPSGRSDVANIATPATLAATTGIQPPTPEMSRVGAPTAPVTVTPQLSRPAIRLSTLRVGGAPALAQPHLRGSATVSQSVASNLPIPQTTMGDRLLVPSFPTAEPPQMAPRLVLNIAPNPRREVQGGFPSRPLPLVTSDQPDATGKPSSFRQPVLPVAPLPVEPEILPGKPISPDDVPTVAAPVVSPEPEGGIDQESAITKLIANSFLPVPMPGLEIRMASPATQADRHQSTQSVEHSPSPAIPPSPPPSPPTPQLNIDEIANKVYQTLQRRQQFERERRGMY